VRPRLAERAAAREERIERALVDDAAVGENDDLVSPAEGSAVVGDRKNGPDVERRGEVVDDLQIGGAGEHAGGGGALHFLATAAMPLTLAGAHTAAWLLSSVLFAEAAEFGREGHRTLLRRRAQLA